MRFVYIAPTLGLCLFIFGLVLAMNLEPLNKPWRVLLVSVPVVTGWAFLIYGYVSLLRGAL